MIRRLLPILTLAAAFIAAALAPAAADPVYQSSTYACPSNASASGVAVATKLVTGIAGKQIYVCGYVLNAGAAAATFQFSTGTGAACATGNAALGPLFTLAIDGVLVDRSPYVNGWSVPAGSDLCVTPSTAASVVVYFTQF